MVPILVAGGVLVLAVAFIVTLAVAATPHQTPRAHPTGSRELEAEDWLEYGNEPPRD